MTDTVSLDELERAARILEQRLPEPVDPDLVDMRLGAGWIPPATIRDFLIDTFYGNKADGTRDCRGLCPVRHDHGSWALQKRKWLAPTSAARQRYGVYNRNGDLRLDPVDIASHALNQSTPTLTCTGEDGKSHQDTDATTTANDHIDLLKADWQQYLADRPDVRLRLAGVYNRAVNRYRPYRPDGSHLTLPGSSDDITLRDYQKNVVAWALRQHDHGIVLAHNVGAGKTYEMAAIAHEFKRLGKAHKPCVVVPNSLLNQWTDSVMRLYPATRLVVCGAGETAAEFWARVAVTDCDLVVSPASKWDQLTMDTARQKAALERMRAQYQSEEDRTGASERERSLARHRFAADMNTLESGLLRQRMRTRITFEATGIDMLLVDEAHHYKNLLLPARVKDLNCSASTKAFNMLTKIEWLREQGLGANLVFATGTPVSNSLSEWYNVMRYVAPDILDATGNTCFTDWMGAFAVTEAFPEITQDGSRCHMKRRFRSFCNMTELRRMGDQFMDVLNLDALALRATIPQVETRKIQVPATPAQTACIRQIQHTAQLVRDGAVDKRVANNLTLCNDGKKVALTAHLYDPERYPVEEDGKLGAVADNVYTEWKEHTEAGDTGVELGAQLVFCDLAVPGKTKTWNAYQDLKQRLVDKGVPAGQIAFIHSYKKDQLNTLFTKVNNGTVRVLIGSTDKLGEGVNVQERLCAIHHVTCPWRASDFLQRRGRIERPGNLNRNVREYYYVSEGTYDAYVYRLVQSKAAMMSQLMDTSNKERRVDDIDDIVLTYSELVVAATDNPQLLRLGDLEVQIGRLQAERAQWASRRKHAQTQTATLRTALDYQQEILELRHQAADEFARARTAAGPTVLDGTTYAKHADANRALALTQATATLQARQVGEHRGMPVMLKRLDGNATLGLRDQGGHIWWMNKPMPGKLPLGQLDTFIDRFQADTGELETRMDANRQELAELQTQANGMWPGHQQLAQAQADYQHVKQEIDRALTTGA